MTITIHTDGACKGNGQKTPSPGGWGAVLDNGKGHRLNLAGHDPDTTNQRMELMAAVEALRRLKRPVSVTLYTDSQYLQKGLSEWLQGWKARSWRTAQGKPAAHADLWQELDRLNQMHDLRIKWVKGHSGHRGNEMADRLANRGAAGETIEDREHYSCPHS